MKIISLISVIAALLSACGQQNLKPKPTEVESRVFEKESPEWWYQQGQNKIKQLKQTQQFPTKAKNVIFFVVDGMNISTITAARILAGQQQGQSGESYELEFEKFPHTALSKTYSLDFQTSSSAATMSAMMTGVKTNKSHVSVNGNGVANKCQTVAGNESMTILELAEQASMNTGVVTTARLTHATPAATYAHTVTRYWEADSDIPKDQRGENCKDIAQQLIDFPYGDGIEVALGGGRRNFLPKTMVDPEYTNKKGKRSDGRDLTQEWLSKYPDSSMVWNLAQFNQINAQNTKHLLGLFEPKHMKYESDRSIDSAGEPSLSQMTQKALDILQHKGKPFFLMVEAGRVDHAHHDGNAYRALHEVVELNQAVKTALKTVDLNETLVIVTADHAHTFNMGGYPQRGNPILGLVKRPNWYDAEKIEFAKDKNGHPYTTLAYTNGPGYIESDKKKPLNSQQVEDKDYLQITAVPMVDETHGGEDVVVYATGAGSQLVHGTIEQNVIFHILRAGIEEQLNR